MEEPNEHNYLIWTGNVGINKSLEFLLKTKYIVSSRQYVYIVSLSTHCQLQRWFILLGYCSVVFSYSIWGIHHQNLFLLTSQTWKASMIYQWALHELWVDMRAFIMKGKTAGLVGRHFARVVALQIGTS